MSIADGELTSLALCWRLERADGAGIALTSHRPENVQRFLQIHADTLWETANTENW